MIKFIKLSTIIILIVLATISIFLLALQNLATLLAIATGLLFLYYLVVYSITYAYRKESNNKILLAIICVLFFVPILWLLVDAESLMELLLFNVKLDMK